MSLNSPLFTPLQLAPVGTNVSETLIPQLPDKPHASSGSIQFYIIPTEKTLFFQGFDANEYNERQPVLLRGCLYIRVLKPSKIKSISLSFQGYQRTDWPEGIPPKRNTYYEEEDIINHTWPFYSMSNPLNVINGGADIYSELPKNLDKDISHLNLNDPVTKSQTSTGNNLDTTYGFLKGLTTQTSRRASDASLRPLDSFNDLMKVASTETEIGKPGTFPPGDYIYNFEHPLRPSLPESTHVTFGEVSYFLEATVIRSGAFKLNLVGKLPMNLVRTPSELNLEENEPIVISRDWEDQLRYDIVIGGKSIILDSYLPLAFRFVPLWGKVALHRIRVYLTENLEYYCQNKRVHRMEPPKKFLLLEHKAKQGKSLLTKKANGEYGDTTDELLPRELEFQLYVPQTLNGKINHALHPDTSFDNIQSHHWVKLCLRISRLDPENPEKRKHYEISIDSPIHVLSPLANHGNTLLPPYDDDVPEDYFLPKYAPSSPPLSPGVEPIDNTHNIGKLFSVLNRSDSIGSRNFGDDQQRASSPARFHHINSSSNNDEPIERDFDMHLDANLYKPRESIRNSPINSPQAMPFPGTLSPMNSPLMRPIHVLRKPSYNPPPFDTESIIPPPNIEVPPPAYEEEDPVTGTSSITRSRASSTTPSVYVVPPEPTINSSIRHLLNTSFNQNSTRNSIISKRTQSSSELSHKPSFEEMSLRSDSLPMLSATTLDNDDPLTSKLDNETADESEEDIVDMGPSHIIHEAVSPHLSPISSRAMSPIPVRTIPIVETSNSPIPSDPMIEDSGDQSSIESSSRRGSLGSQISNDLGQNIPLLNLSTQSLSTNYNGRTASVGSILFEGAHRRLSSTQRPTVIDFVDGDLGEDRIAHKFNTSIFKSGQEPRGDKIRQSNFDISNVKGSDSETSDGTLNDGTLNNDTRELEVAGIN